MGKGLKRELRELCVNYAYYMLMGAGGYGEKIDADRAQCHRDILGILRTSEYATNMGFVTRGDEVGFPKDYSVLMDEEGWERLSKTIGKNICDRLWRQMEGG